MIDKFADAFDHYCQVVPAAWKLGSRSRVLHALTPQQEILLPYNFSSDRERNAIHEILKELTKQETEWYITFGPAWRVEVGLDTPLDDLLGMPEPSKHPDRQHILEVLGEHRDMRLLRTHWRVQENALGPGVDHLIQMTDDKAELRHGDTLLGHVLFGWPPPRFYFTEEKGLQIETD